MDKRLKFNLQAWVIYTVFCYIVLLPLKLYVPMISVSIIIGFYLGMLNTIIRELRILNKSYDGSDLDKEE